MRRLTAIMLALLAASNAPALTEVSSRVLGPGTVRGAFLTRGTSARAGGMGEAFVALSDDASAVGWNPAGLGQVEEFGAVASWESAGEGMGLSHLAAATPLGWGALGASITAMTYGSFTTYNDLGDKLGGQGFMDLDAMAAWGGPVGSLIGLPGWAGGSVEMVRDSAGGTLAGFGVGALLPVGEIVRVGAAVQHLGTSSGGFTLPGRARLGAAIRLDRISLGVEGAYGLTDKLGTVAVGAEWLAASILTMRAGYRQPFKAQRIEGITGLTLGLGVKWKALGVDYAFQPYGDLAMSHRIGVSWIAQKSRSAAAVEPAEQVSAKTVPPAMLAPAPAVSTTLAQPVPVKPLPSAPAVSATLAVLAPQSSTPAAASGTPIIEPVATPQKPAEPATPGPAGSSK